MAAQRPVEAKLERPDLPKAVDDDEVGFKLDLVAAGRKKRLAAEVVVVPALPFKLLVGTENVAEPPAFAVRYREVLRLEPEPFGLSDCAGKKPRFTGGGKVAGERFKCLTDERDAARADQKRFESEGGGQQAVVDLL